MCGIIGLISDSPIDRQNFIQCRDRLTHRGPDDAGFWSDASGFVALGHRRLSIIDLSQAGRQPMTNEDGTLQLVFNGEIYNFKELREILLHEGHIFRSNTDSEVIVHAYEQWGADCLLRFDGMFAFALWDNRRRQLFAARDRLGIKPFHYYSLNRIFAFASELKGLTNLHDLDLELDPTALYDYFTHLYVPTPKSPYRYIRKLPPGHRLMWQEGSLHIEKYWELDPSRQLDIDETEACSRILELLAQSTKARLYSDVPVGVFLSGGIDSSAVTAAAAPLVEEPLRTFSIGFDIEIHSETEYAALVARAFHTRHIERILDIEEAQRLFFQVMEQYDEPFADTSALPTHLISRVARQQATVVLSGDGGDELFGGYNWYAKFRTLDRLSHLSGPFHPVPWNWLNALYPDHLAGKATVHQLVHMPLERYALLLGGASRKEKLSIVPPAILEKIPRDYDDFWYFRQYWRDDLDLMTRLQYLDVKTYLPDDILTKVDRASMMVGQEVRVPLLDHHMVELAFAIPPNIRTKHFQKKYIFKKALKSILPPEILHRPKKGFSIPFRQWFASQINASPHPSPRLFRLHLLFAHWQNLQNT